MAVIAAVRTAGCGSNISAGGTLTLTYIGDGTIKQRGYNAPKLYSASYLPPAVTLPTNTEPETAPYAGPAYTRSAPARRR